MKKFFINKILIIFSFIILFILLGVQIKNMVSLNSPTEIISTISQEECYLCTDIKAELFQIEENSIGIGLLHLNSWEMTTFKIEETPSLMYHGGSKKAGCFVNYNAKQNIIQTELQWGKAKLDIQNLTRTLCQNCLDELINLDHSYQYKSMNTVLIDLETRQIYSLNPALLGYTISNYYISNNYIDKLNCSIIFIMPTKS